jgi:hypothetical protein
VLLPCYSATLAAQTIERYLPALATVPFLTVIRLKPPAIIFVSCRYMLKQWIMTGGRDVVGRICHCVLSIVTGCKRTCHRVEFHTGQLQPGSMVYAAMQHVHECKALYPCICKPNNTATSSVVHVYSVFMSTWALEHV